MYKKYRLIKKYPGLPSNWSIGMEVGVGDYIKEYYRPCSAKYTDFGVKISSVINYPEFWEEIKEPKFTTEDGVEVFKEGDFFIVDTDYNQEGACYFAWSIEKLFIKNKSDLPVSSCVKIFSTEKSAEEYVDLNKPRFSKKDIILALESVGGININQVVYSLK